MRGRKGGGASGGPRPGAQALGAHLNALFQPFKMRFQAKI